MPRSTSRRVTVPEGHVAVLIDVQLAGELQSLIIARRRKLGKRMSVLSAAERNGPPGHGERHPYRLQSKWIEAKGERDILNDLLLALVDAQVEYNS